MEQEQRSKQTILIVLGSLIFILGLSSLILFFQNRLLRQQIASIQTSPSPSPMASADPTGDWKEYNSENLKLSVKFPVGWDVKHVNNEATSEKNSFRIENIDKPENYIEIGKIENPIGKNLDEQINIPFKGIPRKEITLGQIKFTITLAYTEQSKNIYWFEHNGVFYTAISSESHTLITNDFKNQILSTLKFTDEERFFCGGIANLPCPTEGYVCEKEGDYPDAGFWCTKND